MLEQEVREIYGNPQQHKIASWEEVNEMRWAGVDEYRCNNRSDRLYRDVINCEYVDTAGEMLSTSILHTIVATLKGEMKAHKYYANKQPEMDDVQEVLMMVLNDIKVAEILVNNSITGWILLKVKSRTRNHLRNKLRAEHRGLGEQEWATMVSYEEWIDSGSQEVLAYLEESDDGSAIEELEMALDMKNLFKTLTPLEQEVLIRIADGEPQSKIALEKSITQQAVADTLNRAREKMAPLRAYIDKE